jgi:hypothetical protein
VGRQVPARREALAGRGSDHRRFMLRELLDDLDHTERRMITVEEEIERRLRPFEADGARLCTIPGADRVTAWGLLSEIGFNMDQFPSAAHLASWADICPGNDERAGKRFLLERKTTCVDLGPGYFDRRNADAVRRSLVKRLQKVGHSVTLAPAPVFSWE